MFYSSCQASCIHAGEIECALVTGSEANKASKAARKHGVAVTNVPGYSTPAVVSHTFAMYFHLAHHNSFYQYYTRSKQYCVSPIFTHLDPPFSEVAAKTWGIIGLGAIGRSVAQAAQALGAQVIYHSTSGRNLQQDWPHRALETLLAEADVISIHAPLNAQTQDLIRTPQLEAMKTSAILINVGRGGIVHEGDLADALDNGMIAGAAVDVFTQEPLPEDHPLLNLKHPERLFLTPHIAGLSTEARKRLAAGVRQNIDAFLRGERHNRID